MAQFCGWRWLGSAGILVTRRPLSVQKVLAVPLLRIHYLTCPTHIVLQLVLWHLRDKLSLRDLAELVWNEA
jgi:hypothetical protein